MDLFEITKIVHILSATILFGTGIGTAFQMVWAWRTGDVGTIHSVASGVVVADWVFTTPAGIIQPLSGMMLAYLAGWSLTAPWLLMTYGLYLLAFACWVPVVALQLRIRSETAGAREITPRARKAFQIWFALGWPAFIALIIVFYLMVTKPTF